MSNQEPQIKFYDPIKEINKKLDRFFWIIFSVGVVFVITLLVMVVTLVIDSFHFNSATYKEYAKKTEALDQTLLINKDLLERNKEIDNLILKQQSEISKLLKTINKSR